MNWGIGISDQAKQSGQLFTNRHSHSFVTATTSSWLSELKQITTSYAQGSINVRRWVRSLVLPMPGNSRYEAQVIPNSYVDHDRTSRLNTTLIMSADCWEPEKIRGRRLEGEQYSHRLYPSPRPKQIHISSKASTKISSGVWGIIIVLISTFWVAPVSAVFIEFSNCLEESYQGNYPYELQFVPYFLWAAFNTTESTHNLAVQVWGDVKGSGPAAVPTIPPSSNDTAYWQSNSTDTNNGKIVDEPTPGKLTTLSNKVTVLTYEPFNQFVDFCNQLVNATCPLGPAFNASR